MSGTECHHESFAARVEVQRLTAGEGGLVQNFLAEITVTCAGCGTPFHFLGPDAGLSFSRPTVSVGATTLHAPIAPGEAALPGRIRFEMPA